MPTFQASTRSLARSILIYSVVFYLYYWILVTLFPPNQTDGALKGIESGGPFGSIQVLIEHYNYREARDLITLVAEKSTPLMEKYDWIIPKLVELAPGRIDLPLGPSDARLFTVTAGSTHGRLSASDQWTLGFISLKLRQSKKQVDLFHSELFIADTLLHEMAHLKHHGHGSEFYILWAELRLENDQLYGTNISSYGFEGIQEQWMMSCDGSWDGAWYEEGGGRWRERWIGQRIAW